ncbi:MAG: capsule assembly Wzi family protein [bacterium]|nr:capsule assembly Wzi family protein [bacterium]
MKRQTAAWLWMLATALLASGPSAAVDYDLKGSIRSRLAVFSEVAGEVPPEGGQRDTYNLELRARPELTLYLQDHLSLNLAVRGQRNWGATEDAFGSGEVDLDRAYLDVALGRWDLRLGRQAINFGQALIWNPVDLVDSNSPLDFDIVKEGVDTLRASYAVSSTSSVLGLLAFPDGGSIALVRGETLAGSADLGLLIANDARSDERILGFDVKGDLGVGWWAEGAYHDLEEGEDFLRLVVGFDYSWPVRQQLYLALQYYLDESGGTGVDDYDFAALGMTRRFLARQYASVISGLTLDELTSLNGSMIYNLEDDSFVLTLGLRRIFFDDLEVTVRGSLFDGSGPGEYNPVAGSPTFGRQPTETWELYLEWRF